jgi:hypothetical protein
VYCVKVWDVFSKRLASLIDDWCSEGVWRWKNLNYYVQLVEQIAFGDPEYKEIKIQLHERGNSVICSSMKKRVDNTAELVSLITGCRATRALYDNARNIAKAETGCDLTIRLVPRQDAQFGSSYIISKAEIAISATQTKIGALSCLLFELANMTLTKSFMQLDERALRGQVSRDMFAAQSEEIEYEAILIHHKTVNEAAEEQGPDWLFIDSYSIEAADKQKSLRFQEECGHTDVYRRLWDVHYKPSR